MVKLWKEVLNFRHLEEESLGTSWERINSLITTSLDLAISDLMLLQYFYMGLSKDFAQSLDQASRIIGKVPYTSIRDELFEEEKESSPEQEEEVLIAKSQHFNPKV